MDRSLVELHGMLKNAEQNIKKANPVLLVQKGKGKGGVGKGKPKPKSKGKVGPKPKGNERKAPKPSHKRKVCASIATNQGIGRGTTHYTWKN